MTNRVWNSGPPPHVGWWNASVTRNEEVWRWWDGYGWSFAIRFNDDPKEIDRYVAQKVGTMGFEWIHYWPKNARVPRINPETGEKTGG